MADSYYKARICGIFRDEKVLYIYDFRLNSLFEYEFVSEKLLHKYTFENSEGLNILYNHMIKVDDKLVFIPCHANNVAIYDLKTKKINMIELRKNKKECPLNENDFGAFLNYFVCEKEVFLFGFIYPAILIIDTASGKITYIDNWIDELNKYSVNENGWLIGQGCVQLGEELIVPLNCMDGVILINLKKRTEKLVRLKNGVIGYSSIQQVNNTIWLMETDKMIIYIMDMDLKLIRKLKFGNDEPYHAAHELKTEFQMYADNKVVYVFPVYGDHGYIINADTLEIRIWKELDELLFDNHERLYVITALRADKYKDKLCLITGHDAKYHEFDMKTKVFNSRFIYLPKEKANDFFEKEVKKARKNNATIDEKEIPFSAFLKELCKDI